jgi:molybdopterin/thiamine biosynthesis adenylyltransferase
MAHIVQVGAGSGGMVVLDLLCGDARITRLTLIEPDVYKPHNVERHYFPPSAVGEFKAELARDWLRDRRPELQVDLLIHDLCDSTVQQEIEQAIASADVGICAVDNEPAKYHFDGLMRKHRKPWTLGEVLSGGIGGFVHYFVPDGPCYGCVASHLKRDVQEEEPPPAPDYSQPGGTAPEVRIPASKAAIHAIAGLHALVTLGLLAEPRQYSPGFTSLLLTLQRVPDLFEEAFRPHRLRIPRSAECLICQPPPAPCAAEDLDAALDQALARFENA